MQYMLECVVAQVFLCLDKRKSVLQTLLETNSDEEEDRNDQESARTETTHWTQTKIARTSFPMRRTLFDHCWLFSPKTATVVPRADQK